MIIPGFDQAATVYTPNGSAGEYDVTAATISRGRLAYIEQGGSQLGGERGDVGSRRRFLWLDVYTMPDNAQLEIDGQRWNVIEGTPGELKALGGFVTYRRCEVRIAK